MSHILGGVEGDGALGSQDGSEWDTYLVNLRQATESRRNTGDRVHLVVLPGGNHILLLELFQSGDLEAYLVVGFFLISFFFSPVYV